LRKEVKMTEIIRYEKDVELVKPALLPGMAVMVLGTYKETKSWCWLVRCEPGFELPAHGHPCIEHCYTLEGQFEYRGKVYGPGTYMFTSEGAEHGPYKVVGDKPWVLLDVFSGLTGTEELIPEFKQFM
jgi:anti-sigma factor ChrR (cupin superfamily)